MTQEAAVAGLLGARPSVSRSSKQAQHAWAPAFPQIVP